MKKLKWRQKEQRHPTTVIITVSRVITTTTTITIVGCVPGLQIEVQLLPKLQLCGVIYKALEGRRDREGDIIARVNWRSFLYTQNLPLINI